MLTRSSASSAGGGHRTERPALRWNAGLLQEEPSPGHARAGGATAGQAFPGRRPARHHATPPRLRRRKDQRQRLAEDGTRGTGTLHQPQRAAQRTSGSGRRLSEGKNPEELEERAGPVGIGEAFDGGVEASARLERRDGFASAMAMDLMLYAGLQADEAGFAFLGRRMDSRCLPASIDVTPRRRRTRWGRRPS